MFIILDPLLRVLIFVIDLYWYVVIAAAIMSWLITFGVVNTYNRVVYVINDFLYRVTEPALRPLRRFVPNLGGVDITPVILLIGLYFLRILFTDILLSINGPL
jgi:YggT family protein